MLTFKFNILIFIILTFFPCLFKVKHLIRKKKVLYNNFIATVVLFITHLNNFFHYFFYSLSFSY